MRGSEPQFSIQRSVSVIRPREICAEYLYHFLRSESFQQSLKDSINASAQGGVYLGALAKCSVRYPKDDIEQAKIAEVLSTVDRAIAQTQALIAKQQRIKTGLMQDLLTRGIDEQGNLRTEEIHAFKDSPLGRIPIEWESYKIIELSTKVTDGDHHTPNRSESGYFLLSARNVNDGFIDVADVDFVPMSEYKRMLHRCNPEPGDILISCSGTVGRVCAVPEWLECVLVRSAALIKLKKQMISTRFAEWVMRSSIIQRQILMAQRQAAQPNLFQGEIEELQLPTPPIKEQRIIAEKLDAVQQQINDGQSSSDKLNSLKISLMQDLLTGKKPVTALL